MPYQMWVNGAFYRDFEGAVKSWWYPYEKK